MEKLFLIGNLTRDPETRTIRTQDGDATVCNFDIAVNNRRGGQQNAKYFRITAWRKLADNCGQYLRKGSKVMVYGTVEARAYTTSDGVMRAQLDVTAGEVEFLSSAAKQGDADDSAFIPAANNNQFTPVTDNSDLPF